MLYDALLKGIALIVSYVINEKNSCCTLKTTLKCFEGRVLESFPQILALNFIMKARPKKCKLFIMKISSRLYTNESNFHMKSFPLSLAFIMRFTATQKWLIMDSPCYSAVHL